MRRRAVSCWARAVVALSAALAAATGEAQAGWSVRRITSGTEARDKTDGAVVYRARRSLGNVAVGQELEDGDLLRVLAPGITVLVEGPPRADGTAGDRIAVEGREEGPSEQVLGGPASSAQNVQADAPCWLKAGKAYFQVVPEAARRFLCFLGGQDRRVPIGVKGTQFSLEARDDGTTEVVVTQGVVSVGEPGTALYRELTAGRQLRTGPGGPVEGALEDRSVRLRIEGALTRVELTESRHSETALLLRGEDGSWEERTTRREARTVTGSVIHAPGDPRAAAQAVARWQSSGKQVVDALDRAQLWAVADGLASAEQPDFQSALELYDRAAALPGGAAQDVARLQVNAARCELELRRAGPAEARLRAAQQVLPEDPSLLAALAQALLAGREPRELEAAELLARLRSSSGSSGQAALEAGGLALRMSRLAEARRQLAAGAVLLEKSGRGAEAALALGSLGEAVLHTVSLQAALVAWTLAEESLERQLSAAPARTDLQAALADALLSGASGLRDSGQTGQALARCQRALSMREGLLALLPPASPERSERERETARPLLCAGELLFTQGQSEQAVALLQRALAVREKLAGAQPAEPRAQAELAEALALTGEALLAVGRSAEAMVLLRRSTDAREALSAALPRELERGRALAEGLLRLGAALEAHGSSGEAQTALRRALEVSAGLAQESPGRKDLQRGLSRVLDQLAGLLLAQGRSEEALLLLQRSLAVQERLAQAESGRSDLQRGLAASLERAAAVLQVRGKGEEALAASWRALDLVERLAKAEPGRTDLQGQLAGVLQGVGRLLLQQGKKGEARALFLRSLEVRERQAKAEPSRTDLQAALSASLDFVGGALEEQGRKREALALFHRSLETLEQMVAGEPQRVDWKRALVRARERVADDLLDAGKTSEAVKLYQRALELGERLAQEAPAEVGLQTSLSRSRVNVGRLLGSLGSSDEGEREDPLGMYRRSVAALEALAAAEPGRTDVQLQLAWALNRVGGALAGNKKAEEGLALYQRALALREKVLAAEPQRLDVLAMVTSSCRHVGLALLRLKRQQEGLASYQRSLELAAQAQQKLGRTEGQLRMARALADAGSQLTGDLRREGIELLRRSHDQFEQVAKENPHRADLFRQWAYAMIRLGDAILTLRTHKEDELDPEALSLYHAALQLSERLASAEPQSEELQDLLSVALDRATLGSRWAWAIEFWRRGLEIDERLLALHPGSFRYQFNLSFTLIRLGEALHRFSRRDEALELYERALELRVRQAQEQPRSDRRQIALKEALDLVAGSLLSMGRDADALELSRRSMENGGDASLARGESAKAGPLYARALELGEKLLRQEPSREAPRRAQAGVLVKLGDVQLAGGKAEGALANYQAALGLREAQAKALPSPLEALHEVAVAREKTAAALQALGRSEEALAALRQALAEQTSAAALDPRVERRQQLAEAHRRLGLLLRSLGRAPEALEAFRRALELHDKLCTEEPERTDLMTGLAAALLDVGDALRATAAPPAEALEVYRRLVTLRSRQVAASQWRSDLQWGLSVALEREAGVLKGQGDLAGAAAAWKRSIDALDLLLVGEPDRADFKWARDKAQRQLETCCLGAR